MSLAPQSVLRRWTKAHDLLIEYKLTKQQIVDAVAQSDLTFRAGFHELFGLLTRANVPVLIFSAGLYDVIHAVLEKEYKALSNEESTAAPATPSNLHVVSNMMHFDEATGAITGFDGKLIHSFNKNASVVLDTPFWKQCQLEQRRNILLLGDSRSDFKMANGLDFHDDEILRVGFLNTHVDDALDEYLTAYDVVLTHDASLLPIEALMQQLERAAK
uniref:5'-nucleotidase n=1 Tax=Globisporangium ultimum (strain ATCC 200006 / CBS 805.95 / DAOM BR144) TaxID=431595 RepID=K3X1Q3_GLOUD